MSRTHITPPQLAKQRGHSPEKVIAWINSGELRAINISEGKIRPRYLIALTDLEDFDRRRAVVPPPPTQRRQKADDLVEYV